MFERENEVFTKELTNVLFCLDRGCKDARTAGKFGRAYAIVVLLYGYSLHFTALLSAHYGIHVGRDKTHYSIL